jgi:hypothetical protein
VFSSRLDAATDSAVMVASRSRTGLSAWIHRRIRA